MDASSLAVGAYRTETIGGSIRFGYPLSETDGVSFSLGAESVNLGIFPSTPQTYVNFANSFGTKYAYLSSVAGWGRDRRDSAIQPNRGYIMNANVELAGGDLQYYRFGFIERWYTPLSQNLTLSLNADLGYVHGLNNKEVPFFKNFYAGGPGSVRGYRSYSLGPQDSATNVLGGTRKVVGGAEVLFPVPGAQFDKSLRLAAFLDAGQVYGAGQKLALGDLRYSAGVGLAWVSPFGPLRISFGQPLNRKPGDRAEKIQFTFGTAF